MMHKKTCLTELELAQCADAILENRYEGVSSELRNHLLDCDVCASELMMVSEIAGIKEEEKAVKPRNTYKIWVPVLTLAACLIVFFVFRGLFYSPASEGALTPESPISFIERLDNLNAENAKMEIVDTEPDSIADRNKDIQTKVPERMMASLEPCMELEKLVKRSLTATRGSSAIKRISEKVIYTPSQDSLRWSNPTSAKLTIEWYNNKAVQIQQSILKGSAAPIPDFPTGLYYWKLINTDGDLLFCGKVIVED